MNTSAIISESSTQSLKKKPIEAKPFLKWAGGKQQMVKQYETLFPEKFNRYFEPFLGGGAIFFHLWSIAKLKQEIVLSDSNAELINAYVVVRDELNKLINLLKAHKKLHGQDYYYEIRSLDRKEEVQLNSVEKAARTIYLNRTCFNGLYRVNSKGQFNVPMGKYNNPSIVRRKTLERASQALQGTVLKTRDFREVLKWAERGDFIYFDPPYVPVSKTSNFTSYTSADFSDEDQKELAQTFTKLSEMGCYCMLSNSYTPFILDLYSDYRIETVEAVRAINSDSNGRGAISEVVVLNY